MSGLSFHWLRRSETREGGPLLSIHNLCVKVGIREIIAQLHLDVYKGDQILITGPNGSGKSTLLNAIVGVAPARRTGGSIFFGGIDITGTPTHLRSGMGIAYLRQQAFLFEDLSIEDNLRLMLGDYGPHLFQKKFPEWYVSLPIKKGCGHLSGGQKKKLAWAIITLTSAKLWLFDEPEAGLSERFSVPDGRTFLMVSHERNEGGVR